MLRLKEESCDPVRMRRTLGWYDTDLEGERGERDLRREERGDGREFARDSVAIRVGRGLCLGEGVVEVGRKGVLPEG